MPKKGRVQMPQSTAGLVRYFEESKEAIKLKPEHVIVICVVLIAIELMFKIGMFGF